MIFIDQTIKPVTAEMIIEKAKEHDTNQVFILNELEWEFEIPGGKEAIDTVKESGIDLKILTGGACREYFTKFYSELGLKVNKDVIFWPTIWLNWSELELSHTDIKHRRYFPPAPKHHFICLNNRPHEHRCVTIDALARHNLIDKGVVTWHNFLSNCSEHDYEFKHFNSNTILKLDDDFENTRDSFSFPKEFHESFFHLVTESTTKVYDLSEKTAIPLLLKKPFAIIGAVGYHKFLQDLGFELYTEIIDYSFDSEPDLYKRVDMLVEQMHSIAKLELETSYSIIKDKALRNYHRAIDIIHDNEFIPDEVELLVDKFGSQLKHHYHAFLDKTL